MTFNSLHFFFFFFAWKDGITIGNVCEKSVRHTWNGHDIHKFRKNHAQLCKIYGTIVYKLRKIPNRQKHLEEVENWIHVKAVDGNPWRTSSLIDKWKKQETLNEGRMSCMYHERPTVENEQNKQSGCVTRLLAAFLLLYKCLLRPVACSTPVKNIEWRLSFNRSNFTLCCTERLCVPYGFAVFFPADIPHPLINIVVSKEALNFGFL